MVLLSWGLIYYDEIRIIPSEYVSLSTITYVHGSTVRDYLGSNVGCGVLVVNQSYSS